MTQTKPTISITAMCFHPKFAILTPCGGIDTFCIELCAGMYGVFMKEALTFLPEDILKSGIVEKSSVFTLIGIEEKARFPVLCPTTSLWGV